MQPQPPATPIPTHDKVLAQALRLLGCEMFDYGTCHAVAWPIRGRTPDDQSITALEMAALRYLLQRCRIESLEAVYAYLQGCEPPVATNPDWDAIRALG